MTMKAKCNFCPATAYGTRDELIDKQWARAVIFAPKMYIFTFKGRKMDVDMTSRGLFGWWALLRFRIGMRIAGWKWEKKIDVKE